MIRRPSLSANKIGQAADLLVAVRILIRRGLLDPRHLRAAVDSVRSAARVGPFAAALVQPVRRVPDSAAIVDERGALTFAELEAAANQLANGLRKQGVSSSDVIGTLCRDHRGMVLTLVAAGKIGAQVVLMNTGFAGPQLADVTGREGVSVLMHDAEFAPAVAAVPRAVRRISTWTDDGDQVDADTPTIDDVMAGQSAKPPPLPHTSAGMVLLTSGTTGTPKGAPRKRVSPLLTAQLLHRIPIPRGGTMVMAAPIFHGTGLSQFTLALALGSTVVLRQRKFDAAATIATVAKHRAQTLVVVPTMLQRIVDLDDEVFRAHDTSSLKVIFAAGSALSPDICHRTAARFADVLYNLYGSTEVAVATVATPDELRRAPGTVGRAPVGCRVALYDQNRRRITTPDTRGSIFAASGLSFSGYTDGATKETVDGLLATGDVGHFDTEGLLFVDGRDDDMIVSGGENVFPLEVENLLIERDDVVDVAVIGVDDEEFGKRLRAYIVAKPDSKPEVREIQHYVRSALARHKVPRDVIFVDSLPRNATGKLLRRQLS